MFPEYSDLIAKLQSTDAHFDSLYQQHSRLDQQVNRMVSRSEPAKPEEIEKLKKEKLHLKDELYTLLKKAAQA